jgi:hypothetical protein
MPRGGHARSGPAKDPKSARSESRGFASAVLPAAGYSGRIPGLNRFLPQPTPRHRELWKELWSYPQACVWINEPWRYSVVAELVRLMSLTEQADCAVGVWSAIRQRRDDLGLSTAGRRQEGWEIVSGVALSGTPEDDDTTPADEVSERRERRSQNLRPDAE